MSGALDIDINKQVIYLYVRASLILKDNLSLNSL